MGVIYHVTTREAWYTALKKGFYEAPSLQAEGFIHCSELQQVDGVLQRYFKGKNNLVKLVLDPELLQSNVKYELAPSVDQKFPHVYGCINLDAVVSVEQIN